MKPIYTYFSLLIISLTTYACHSKPLSYGNPKAPLKVIELVSPSCHICAEFHRTLLREIKKKYVDKGLIHLDIHLMAYNYLDLLAATFILSNPHPKKAYDIIFSTQPTWLMKNDPVKALKAILVKDKSYVRLKKKQLEEYETTLLKASQALDEKHDVDAIPMLIIGRRKIIGLLSWKDLEKHIDEALNHVRAGKNLDSSGPRHDHKKKSAEKNRRSKN